jgi:tetratricopeptide (TPR) repeat protein
LVAGQGASSSLEANSNVQYISFFFGGSIKLQKYIFLKKMQGYNIFCSSFYTQWLQRNKNLNVLHSSFKFLLSDKKSSTMPLPLSATNIRMQALLSTFNRYPRQIWALAAILVTLSVYLPVWHNGFVNWDDNIYITDNPLVLQPLSETWQSIFLSSFEGHYHPLTLLSLKADYFLFGLNPRAFHLHNLLIHLLSTALVFSSIFLVTRKPMVAGITALFFGIHPMHVESVAWAAARKDVLFTLWFLLSWLFYTRYFFSLKRIYLLLSLLAFLLSVLSKGQAVFLPVCLVLTDLYLGRKLFARVTWINKIPYFAIALALGIVAVIVQEQTGYTAKSGASPGFFEMIMVAGYAFAFYLLKIILPLNLSAYYAYPDYLPGAYTPAMWLGLVIMLAFAALMIYSYRKNRTLFFGAMFFLVNIFVFLKWIPVSNYIIADRYTYVSGIGIFFLAATALDQLKQRGKAYALGSGIILVALLWSYTLASASRVTVWESTESLTNDILARYPDVYTALNARGADRMGKGHFRGALADFSHAINVQPNTARAYANRGDLYAKTGKTEQAMADYDDALKLEPGNDRYLNNRGLCREKANRLREALADFDAAIQLKPRTGIYYANRAKVHNKLADFKAALDDVSLAKSLGIDLPFLTFEAGFAYYNLQDFNRAVIKFNKVLAKEPVFTDALIYRGYASYNLGDYLSAEADLSRVLAQADDNGLVWAMRGLARVRLGDTEGACLDFRTARLKGLSAVEREIEKYCR